MCALLSTDFESITLKEFRDISMFLWVPRSSQYISHSLWHNRTFSILLFWAKTSNLHYFGLCGQMHNVSLHNVYVKTSHVISLGNTEGVLIEPLNSKVQVETKPLWLNTLLYSKFIPLRLRSLSPPVNLMLHLTLTREQEPQILELLRLGSDSLPTSKEKSTF